MSWKSLGSILLLVGIALSIPQPVRATESGAASHAVKSSSIATVVGKQFKKWDKNGDGKLSREEIDAAVSDPTVRGDAAAAAAALHVYFRDNAKAAPLDLNFVTKASAEKPQSERRDVTRKAPHFQSDFEDFRDHIQRVPHDVFATNSLRLQDLKQGSLGDCYFVCAVGAMLYQHRSRVEQILHPHNDGSCDLTFADGNKVFVKKMTDAQIALSSSAGKQGLWLNILEEGFGQLRRQQSPQIVLQGDIPIDAISRGGNPRTSIELLTGHKAEGYDLTKLAKDAAAMSKLRSALIAGTKSHLLMTCSTPAKGKLPPGIVNWHCYAVLGFNESTNKVLLWNPWGNNFKPKSIPAGVKNGYATQHGRFEISFSDLVRTFVSFDCESTEPARKELLQHPRASDPTVITR